MYKVNNFFNNDDVKVISELGPFKVVEYQRDLSVMPSDAMLAYYCKKEKGEQETFRFMRNLKKY